MANRTYPTKRYNQKETHTEVIDVKDRDGDTVNVSGATITLWCKRKLNDGTTYLFEKEDADFTKNVDSKDYRVSVVYDVDDMDFVGIAYVIIFFDIGANSKKKGIYRLDMEITPEVGP